MPRTARISILAVALASCAAPVLAQAGADVERAKSLIVSGRYAEALAAAQDAERATPSSYEAAYYVAMAQLGLKQYAAARTEAQKALELAPADSKPAVEKLLATISSSNAGTGQMQEADAAAAAGEYGNAAALYEKVFQAGGSAAIGLKAADIYVAKLDSPVDAARVYRAIVAANPSGTDADVAIAALAKLKPALTNIAAQKVAAASAGPANTRALLNEAAAADPGYAPIYETAAKFYAAAKSQDALLAMIKKLQALDAFNPETIGNLPNMRTLTADPAFAEKLRGVIGNARMEKIAGVVGANNAASNTALAQRLVNGLRNYYGYFELNEVRVADDRKKVCVDSKVKNGFGHVFQHNYDVWLDDGVKAKYIVDASNNPAYWTGNGCPSLPNYTGKVQ